MFRILSPILLFQFILGQSLENYNTSPMHILGTINKVDITNQHDTTFNIEWVKELKLLLPCKNTKVPKRSTRLPSPPLGRCRAVFIFYFFGNLKNFRP